MVKKKYDSEDGIWRTVGGRRIFIRNGQDLSSAMKESGKFKTRMNEKAVKGAREEDLKEQYKDSLNNVSKMEYNGEITREEYDKAVKDINKAYIDKRNSYLKGERNYEQVDKEWTDLAKKMEKDYDEFGTTNWQDEKRLNELSLERDTLGIKDDKFYTKKDETNRYKEKTLNDVYSYTDKQIDENKNPLFSREDYEYKLYKRAKENPDSIDPMTENSTDWEALDKKYSGRYKTEKIREQISQPVEYNYKSENLKEFSKRDIRDVSNEELIRDEIKNFVNGGNKKETYLNFTDRMEKIYGVDKDTIDKRFQHVEDNLYYEKTGQLITEKRNKTYNRNLEELKKYQEKMLKNDEYLQTNRPNVYFNKMVQESNLRQKYKGTYEYLQNTTNMSGTEILELLKKIDEDKK